MNISSQLRSLVNHRGLVLSAPSFAGADYVLLNVSWHLMNFLHTFKLSGGSFSFGDEILGLLQLRSLDSNYVPSLGPV